MNDAMVGKIVQESFQKVFSSIVGSQLLDLILGFVLK